jgi:sugar phosphate permease
MGNGLSLSTTPTETISNEPKPARVRRRQGLTIGLLFLGYAGCYLCRSHLSVTMPLIIDELATKGISANDAKNRLGDIASLGVLAYAIGKFLFAGSADFFGGRRNFLGGMGGAVVFSVVFALGGSLPVFTMAWIGNRLLQSISWAGLVKVSSRWFSYNSYGIVMAVLSLSFLFGDAAARAFMGWLIREGLGWREVFCVAAGCLFVIFLLNLLFLSDSRSKFGFPEPEANPINLFHDNHESSGKPNSLRQWLGPFLRSPLFLLVCGLSLGCTSVREAFNTWTPTYFHQSAGFSEGRAAELSSLFPLFGGISVVLAGYLSDKMGRPGRAIIICIGLSIASAALFFLARIGGADDASLAVILVSLVAFGLIGPYSYLAGAFAMDFGGKQGSAISSSLIDTVGYLGAVLAGGPLSRLSVSYGWPTAFGVLGGVTGISAVAAAVLWVRQRQSV